MLAFILSRRDFREHDQRVSLYTKEAGKLELLARGVKKITSKNSPFLEPGFLIEVEMVAGQEIDHLIRAVPVCAYKNIRGDFNKRLLLQAAFFLVDTMVEVHQKDVDLFLFLQGYLNFLEITTLIEPSVMSAFVLKLWHHLGFTPVIDRCVVCEKKITTDSFYFSAAAGGVVGRTCHSPDRSIVFEGIPVTERSLTTLGSLLQKEWVEINTLSVSLEEERLIESFITYHTEKKIIKEGYVDSVLRAIRSYGKVQIHV